MASRIRNAEFVQATDPRNSMLNRIVARYDVSPAVVPQVSAVQQEFQQRAIALRSLPATERAVQGQALATEAAAKLTTLLGPRAYEAYKDYGGQWVQSLATPFIPSSRATPSPPVSSPTKG